MSQSKFFAFLFTKAQHMMCGRDDREADLQLHAPEFNLHSVCCCCQTLNHFALLFSNSWSSTKYIFMIFCGGTRIAACSYIYNCNTTFCTLYNVWGHWCNPRYSEIVPMPSNPSGGSSASHCPTHRWPRTWPVVKSTDTNPSLKGEETPETWSSTGSQSETFPNKWETCSHLTHRLGTHSSLVNE